MKIHVGREPGNEAMRVDVLFVMLQHFLNEFYSSFKFGYDSTYNLVWTQNMVFTHAQLE